MAILGRMDPVKLARELGSRINVGPMTPADFYPEGIEGLLTDLANRGDDELSMAARGVLSWLNPTEQSDGEIY